MLVMRGMISGSAPLTRGTKKNSEPYPRSVYRSNDVPVSDAFRDYVLEQLSELGGVSARRMFGGVGLYCGELFFGVINDNLLYLRVDDATRPLFEATGMTALRPVRAKPEVVAAYYQAPDHVLEDAEILVEWARRSVAVAAGQSRPAPRRVSKRQKKNRT
jgi:DNA transformation protein